MMATMLELSEDEIRIVLSWAAATDFEAKLDLEDITVIDRLAGAVGEDPHDYCEVYLSTRRKG